MNAKTRSLSKGKDKIYLTWQDYLDYIDLLIQFIISSKVKFSYVYGPPRGGLIPATIISHAFNKPFLDDFDWDLLSRGKRKILIVDDIIDSAKTMNSYIGLLTSHEISYYTATIFKHKDSPLVPNFYVVENSKWIVFPYEKD